MPTPVNIWYGVFPKGSQRHDAIEGLTDGTPAIRQAPKKREAPVKLDETTPSSPNPVLVTGGARRIGKAIVEHLAARGCAVIIHTSARSAQAGEALAAGLRTENFRAAHFCADLRNEGECVDLIHRAGEPFGPLRGLVNNASVFEKDAADGFSCAGFGEHIDVNLRAPLILSRGFYAQARDGAAIVNIADQRVLRPRPDFFTYSLSKAALWQATQMLAQAYAPRVRVNAVAPGPILPNIHDGDAAFADEVARLPLARPPSPLAVAEAVEWLLAAKHVTGQIIAVDGGQHLE